MHITNYNLLWNKVIKVHTRADSWTEPNTGVPLHNSNVPSSRPIANKYDKGDEAERGALSQLIGQKHGAKATAVTPALNKGSVESQITAADAILGSNLQIFICKSLESENFYKRNMDYSI